MHARAALDGRVAVMRYVVERGAPEGVLLGDRWNITVHTYIVSHVTSLIAVNLW